MREPFDTQSLCLVATLLLWAAVASAGPGAGELQPTGIWVRPRRRPFRPTLTLPGQVECPRTDEVMSHYRWWTNIQWMAPEGSSVEKDEVVAIVFHEDLERIAGEAEKRLARKKAELAARTAEAKLDELDRQRELREAERTLREAELALRKLARGPEPEELRLAELEVQKAQARADATAGALRRMGMLAESGAAPKERGRQLLREKELAAAELEAARAELAAAKNEPPELELAAQQSVVAGARAARKAARQGAEAKRAKDAAEIGALRGSVAGTTVDVEKWRDRVRTLKRKAGMAGLVVWRNSPGAASVWPGIIATVIDPKVAVFAARATEDQVARIVPGQQCRLELPARPGRHLSGQVTAVAVTGNDLASKMAFGEQEEWERSGVRVYDVFIQVADPEGPGLYQGLVGRAHLPVGEQTTALVIPRVCVRKQNGRASALVWKDQEWRSRELELGPEDEDYVVVVSGLALDDRVAIPRREKEPE